MKKSSLRNYLALATLSLAAPLHAQSGPTLNVTPVLIDFGQVVEGGQGRQNLTLSNLTDDVLNITEFTQTGAGSFSLDIIGGTKPCGAETPSLAANDDCTMEVFFNPEADEDASGTLTFTPNGDATKAITVRLQGESVGMGGGCSLSATVAPSGAWKILRKQF